MLLGPGGLPYIATSHRLPHARRHGLSKTHQMYNPPAVHITQSLRHRQTISESQGRSAHSDIQYSCPAAYLWAQAARGPPARRFAQMVSI